jgi:hypothetical protein
VTASTPPNPIGDKVAIGAGIVAILGGTFAAFVWLWRRIDGWLVRTHRHYGERAFSKELDRSARHERELRAMEYTNADTVREIRDLRVDFDTFTTRVEKKIDDIGDEMREAFRVLGQVEGEQRAHRHTGARSRYPDLTPESDAL